MKPPRLAAATVDQLSPAVRRPRYTRDTVGCGIVHLGVGAFMRAHIATYCEAALEAEGGDWGIAGVSLRRPDVSQQLEPQDCLYLVAVRSADDCRYQLVGALRSMAVATADPGAVVTLLARPETRVVTVTVTEKGYCVDTQAGGLDTRHPDIRHDLQPGNAPRSLVGMLHAACRQRRTASGGPVTIVACDNLPGNGRLLRQAVLDFAGLADDDLAGWIREHVSFPSTMVDRIVPATTAADIDAAAAAVGVVDHGLVCTEAFTQWVIEDDFVNGRPAWEAAGALLVADVEPYETAKLRLLNGAHSSIAYLGYLAGYEYVHEVVAEEQLAAFVEEMMRREISPVTPAPAGMEHADYIAALLRRFRNPALRHRTWQIAMDGSQKLPQRLLATLALQRRRGGPYGAIALAVAAWMRYVLGTDERGRRIDVRDPLAAQFAAIAASTGLDPSAAPAIVAEFLRMAPVFGSELPSDAELRECLAASLAALLARGVGATVRTYLERGEVTDGNH